MPAKTTKVLQILLFLLLLGAFSFLMIPINDRFVSSLGTASKTPSPSGPTGHFTKEQLEAATKDPTGPITEEELEAARRGLIEGYEKGSRSQEEHEGITVGAWGTLCNSTNEGFLVNTEEQLTNLWETSVRAQRLGIGHGALSDTINGNIADLLSSQRAFTIDCNDVVEILQQSGNLDTGRKIQVEVVSSQLTYPSRSIGPSRPVGTTGWTMVDFFVPVRKPSLAERSAPAPQSFAANCLSYGPTLVTLTGTLTWQWIDTTDHQGNRWILNMEQPICINEGEDPSHFPAQNNLSNVQLYSASNSLVNTKVKVTGTFVPVKTGHHETKVIMRVVSMEPAQNP
jgi:hypothetical protein